MLYASTCSLHRVISQLLLAKHAMHNQTVCTSQHMHWKTTEWQFPGKKDLNTWQNPWRFLQNHLISTEYDFETHVTLASEESKTQTSAGLLFSLHVSWGCPVLNQIYFANVPWDLISCVHTLYLVASGRWSLRLCTFISSQGKAVWGNNPHWVQDEHGCSAKLWDEGYGRAGWDI